MSLHKNLKLVENLERKIIRKTIVRESLFLAYKWRRWIRPWLNKKKGTTHAGGFGGEFSLKVSETLYEAM